ncbi:MAG: hypothetical protein ACFFDW_03270 [Candidatus Thorarchaeota archaeon]
MVIVSLSMIFPPIGANALPFALKGLTDIPPDAVCVLALAWIEPLFWMLVYSTQYSSSWRP